MLVVGVFAIAGLGKLFEPGDCVSIEFAFRWPSPISGMFSSSPCPTARTIAAT